MYLSPTPCTTFDEQDQLVSVTGQNAYQSPSASDIRGPCPGLNAAANHGFLPRNGYVCTTQLSKTVITDVIPASPRSSRPSRVSRPSTICSLLSQRLSRHMLLPQMVTSSREYGPSEDLSQKTTSSMVFSVLDKVCHTATMHTR